VSSSQVTHAKWLLAALKPDERLDVEQKEMRVFYHREVVDVSGRGLLLAL